jgi:5-bromo-4-chloroindolyl phosphate hydrolysis protein
MIQWLLLVGGANADHMIFINHSTTFKHSFLLSFFLRLKNSILISFSLELAKEREMILITSNNATEKESEAADLGITG